MNDRVIYWHGSPEQLVDIATAAMCIEGVSLGSDMICSVIEAGPHVKAWRHTLVDARGDVSKLVRAWGEAIVGATARLRWEKGQAA